MDKMCPAIAVICQWECFCIDGDCMKGYSIYLDIIIVKEALLIITGDLMILVEEMHCYTPVRSLLFFLKINTC